MPKHGIAVGFPGVGVFQQLIHYNYTYISRYTCK